jgi:amino acid permease
MNLGKSMLGAVVLTLPFSGSQLGWITSIILITSVAAATYCTLVTMSKASDACVPSVTTYAQLATHRISHGAADLLQVLFRPSAFRDACPQVL